MTKPEEIANTVAFLLSEKIQPYYRSIIIR